MATWVVKSTLPKNEGEGLAQDGAGRESAEGAERGTPISSSLAQTVEQARELAEADPQVVGFAHAVHHGRFFFKRVGTGFHRRTPWRDDDFAVGHFEWHYILERVPRAKVLFLPAAMRGHAVPLMRLAEWFVGGEDFEVHVWLGGQFVALAPEGAVLHRDCGAERMDACAAALAGVFGKLTACRDWYGSMAGMVGAMAEDPEGLRALGDLTLGAARLVKRVSPDLVIADSSFATDGAIPGLCARHSAPFVQLECTGQPGSSAWAWLRVLLTDLGAFGRMGEAGGEQDARLLAETGPKLEKPHDWPRILPSCAALARKAPAATEVCVGPFLPLPAPDADGGLQRRALPEGAASGLGAGLRAWLLEGGPEEPIVYVAFGTLVRLGADLAARLAAGLEAGAWRVLWALPEAQRAGLPERLRAGGRRWRLEASVPQAEVLGFAGVRAFVSHCGQNSTQEALSLGVPMVCCPVYCDQFEWAEAVCARRAGVALDKLALSPQAVQRAIEQVLADEGLRSSARACAAAMAAEQRAAPGGGPGGGGPAGVPSAARVALQALGGTWRPRPPQPLLEQLGAAAGAMATSVGDGVSSAAESSAAVAGWMGSKLRGLLPERWG